VDDNEVDDNEVDNNEVDDNEANDNMPNIGIYDMPNIGIQANDNMPNSSIQVDESPQSPTNSVNSNPGFADDSMADQYEFQRQQTNRLQQRQRIQAQNQQEGHEVWELEQQLEEWSGRCPLCFINGHDSRHSIEDCVQNGSNEIRNGWQEMKRLMQKGRWFGAFSCCFNCHVPQAICQKWVQKKEQGRWERLNGVSCQFEGIIMPTVIIAMLESKDWIVEMIHK
jgi:hypothetical protein